MTIVSVIVGVGVGGGGGEQAQLTAGAGPVERGEAEKGQPLGKEAGVGPGRHLPAGAIREAAFVEGIERPPGAAEMARRVGR